MNKDKSQTICPLPWNHLATTSSGTYRLCCNSVDQENQVKKDGSSLKIYKNSFDSVRRGDFYNEVRKQMLLGKKPSVCQTCYKLEDEGVPSSRESYRKQYWETTLKIELLTPEESNDLEGFPIQYIDLRLGNLCNLRCRMCNPWSSSSWIKEAPYMFENESFQVLDWPDKNEAWIDEILKHTEIEEIYLTGGEPTLIKANIRLLNLLLSRGGEDIKIKINSNVVALESELLNTLRNFKNVQFKCSIDAMGELNDYIRAPSLFNDIEASVDMLLQESFNIEVQTTVQNYNFLNMPEWFSFCIRKDWPEPTLTILDDPACLDIRRIPENITEFALLEFNKHLNSFNLNENCRLKEISKLIGISPDEKQWQGFIHFTSKLDDLRSLNYRPRFSFDSLTII